MLRAWMRERALGGPQDVKEAVGRRTSIVRVIRIGLVWVCFRRIRILCVSRREVGDLGWVCSSPGVLKHSKFKARLVHVRPCFIRREGPGD